jgi:hypothetical protein
MPWPEAIESLFLHLSYYGIPHDIPLARTL